MTIVFLINFKGILTFALLFELTNFIDILAYTISQIYNQIKVNDNWFNIWLITFNIPSDYAIRI